MDEKSKRKTKSMPLRIFISVLLGFLALLVVLSCFRKQAPPPAEPVSELAKPSSGGEKSASGLAGLPFENLVEKIDQFDDLDFAEFNEIGISAVPPVGFAKARNFHGFKSDSPQGTVTFTTAPVSYPGSTKPFLASLASSRPNAVVREHRLGKWNANFLYYDEEQKGKKIGSQYLVLGNEIFSWIVSASYVDDGSAIGRDVAATLLSLRIKDSVDFKKIGGDTTFQLESSMLQKTPGWAKTLVFTQNGSFPPKDAKEPFVKATELFELTPTTEEALSAFARRLLLPSPTVKIEQVLSENQFSLDDKPVIEIAAHAFDQSTKTPTIHYLAVIFEENSQVVVNAWGGREDKEKWLAEFAAITRSYSR